MSDQCENCKLKGKLEICVLSPCFQHDNWYTKELKRQRDLLVNAVKLAYRKHHLGDMEIGWEELSDALLNVLCETLGDKGFQIWLKKHSKG